MSSKVCSRTFQRSLRLLIRSEKRWLISLIKRIVIGEKRLCCTATIHDSLFLSSSIRFRAILFERSASIKILLFVRNSSFEDRFIYIYSIARLRNFKYRCNSYKNSKINRRTRKYKSKVAGRSIRIQLSLQERVRDCVSIDDNYRGKLGGAGRMQIRPAEIRVALSWKESRACCASVHRSAQSNQKTFVIDEMESSPFPAGPQETYRFTTCIQLSKRIYKSNGRVEISQPSLFFI